MRTLRVFGILFVILQLVLIYRGVLGVMDGNVLGGWFFIVIHSTSAAMTIDILIEDC